jgi:hypothetical protein
VRNSACTQFTLTTGDLVVMLFEIGFLEFGTGLNRVAEIAQAS